ncbi:MAG: fructose-1,6-bisphosphatase [Oscillospiraceae bacterium]|nr:fructose-1,6-bisphosphatase [Oscillospiraceae bacterium]
MQTEEVYFQNKKYLELLAEKYPTVQAASSRIISLQASLDLPKGTEHFMSDLHGEYEAFNHILNNASGAIREKVDRLYANTMTSHEKSVLSTLIYYPEQKLAELKPYIPDLDEWYRITLLRLVEICRLVASKYTRSRVNQALPRDFASIIDELLNTNFDVKNKEQYYLKIISTIVDLQQADAFIAALSSVIKRLVVDRLHIVGDIFDRGPGADVIMEALMDHHSVDIQWGNHDILWMGAAAGSMACIANVINNSMSYNNLDVVEIGYGINLRPLATFAGETYGDCACFSPKLVDQENYKPKDIALVAKMHKAIAMIQFKLEGQIIRRRPEYAMEDRLLLDKIDPAARTVAIGGREYTLRDWDFPTVDPHDPYALSPEEREVMDKLKVSFLRSEKLQKHVRFLYSNGGLYTCYNGNLLFHGCIPMAPDGSFLSFPVGQRRLAGREYMDYADLMARQGYNAAAGSAEKQEGEDFLWFLWAGRNSPLFGRERMTTFERLLVEDQETWLEPKNAYYQYNQSEERCIAILREFGLTGEHSHIVNGHVPVKSRDGENPVKAGGRLIVIDGGFCRAYQPTTGIAGYTLIYSSYGVRISAHEPFGGVQNAIVNNKDILSVTTVYETRLSRITVSETDRGRRMTQEIDDLKMLLYAYRKGYIKEAEPKELS